MQNLSFPPVKVENVRLPLREEEGDFKCERLSFRNILFEDLEGFIRKGKVFLINLNFNLYRGKGRAKVIFSDIPENPDIIIYFKVRNLNLSEFSTSINKQIYISGLMNIEGKFKLRDKEGEVIFETVDKRGIKKFMNFGAVKAVMALANENPVKQMAGANFSYRKIKGKISVRKKYLTIEGLAGKKGENQFIVKGNPFGTSINILVHGKTNTIRLKDFKKRIKNALTAIR